MKAFRNVTNLDPTVLKLFCQRLVAWRDPAKMEWKCARISGTRQRVVTRNSQSKKDILFEFPRVSPGDQPLTKMSEDAAIEIETLLGNLTQGLTADHENESHGLMLPLDYENYIIGKQKRILEESIEENKLISEKKVSI